MGQERWRRAGGSRARPAARGRTGRGLSRGGGGLSREAAASLQRALTPLSAAENTERERIREAIQRLCTRFDDAYWLERDRDGRFPEEFYRAIADDGWLGVAMPETYGGSGLGIAEAAVMMQAVAQSGAGFSGASAIHMNIFGLNPVVVFGTSEQKQRFLPPLIRGEEQACLPVTEPDARPDTAHIQTK